MHSVDQCFTPFTQAIEGYDLPSRFTFPFCYEPHPLCIAAANELQQHLQSQKDWQHDFGIDNTSEGVGKMFGVLVVKNSLGELGYLSAFSGKIADANLLPKFVPPVFDMLAKDSFFRTELAQITAINTEVKALQANPNLDILTQQYASLEQQFLSDEQRQRDTIIAKRQDRKAQRKAAQDTLNNEQLVALEEELSKQSVADKNQLKFLKLAWQEKIAKVGDELSLLTDEIKYLKKTRKKLSNKLQKKIFAQYDFINQFGKFSDLNAIFNETPEQTPPAGAGECAAPKLLQYAFLNNLTPVAIAEFWWGVSPKSEIRKHKKFYASCTNKCQPILSHMLDGIEMDDNPLLQNGGADKTIEIIYQDEHMLVINKPEELLSVPGKNINDSVYTRIKAQFPDATGPLIVHRLDMSTSGIMVLALTKEANKSLQRQFITRCVEKRYIAVVEGEVSEQQGFINLPLRQDLEDRPRQLVCYEHGKEAETTWQLIGHEQGKSRLQLYPKTGRTHQLRMHCAHQLGLNLPIVGDDLYGTKTNRLHLHAQYLELNHPITRQRMTFEIEPNF